MPKVGFIRHNRGRKARVKSNQRLSLNDVYSYHANRQTVPTKPAKARRRGHRVAWQRIPELLALVAVLVCGGFILTLSTQPKVTVSSVVSNSLLHKQTDYQKGAHDILQSSPFSYSKLTIDTAGFRKKMLEKYPELADVSVVLPLTGRRPVVELIPEQPAFLLLKDGQKYVLDARGRVDARAADVKGLDGLHLPTLNDDSKLDVRIGKNVLAERDVDFITTVLLQLKGGKVPVESIKLPPLPSELQLKPKGVPYYVKFNMQGDAAQQSGALLATLNKLRSDSIHPAEYIDVRVEERVYFK